MGQNVRILQVVFRRLHTDTLDDCSVLVTGPTSALSHRARGHGRWGCAPLYAHCRTIILQTRHTTSGETTATV